MLVDLRRLAAQLTGQDLNDLGTAETALAATHACTDTALDGVHATGAQRTMDGLEDLSLGDGLTAADHIAVQGIFLHQLLLDFQRLLTELNDTL